MLNRDVFNNKSFVLGFFIMVSVYFLNFNIDIGFAFKPYMWMSLIGLIVIYTMDKKQKNILNIKQIWDNLLNYEKCYVLFFIFIVLRGLFSKYRVDSIKMTGALFTVIILYFVVYRTLKNLEISKIVNLIFISGMIFSVLSLILFIFGVESAGFLDRGIYRLTGLVQDPNIFVLFLTPVYAITLFKIINKEYKYIIALIFILIPLILSYSRGGLIGIFVVTFFIIINNISKENIKKISIAVVIVSSIVVLLFTYTNINEAIYNISGIDLIGTIKIRLSDTTGSGRLQLWKNAMYFLAMNPIIGIGLYNFRQYNQFFFENPRYVHNVFIEILCENGIIGSSIFVVFLGAFIKNKSKYKEGKIIKIIILSQLIQLFFLSGISSEIVYMMFAIYKSIEHRS